MSNAKDHNSYPLQQKRPTQNSSFFHLKYSEILGNPLEILFGGSPNKWVEQFLPLANYMDPNCLRGYPRLGKKSFSQFHKAPEQERQLPIKKLQKKPVSNDLLKKLPTTMAGVDKGLNGEKAVKPSEEIKPEAEEGKDKESPINSESGFDTLILNNGSLLGKSKKAPGVFKFLNFFLIDFFLLRPLKPKSYEKLGTFDREVMCLILKRLFRNKKFSVSHMTLVKLQQLQKLVTKKRNEEKIKQIWKRFIKNEFSEFCSNEFSIKPVDLGPSFSKVNFNDDWKRFFVFFFEEIIKKKSIFPLDLIFDICAEKSVNKTSLPSPKNVGGWRKVKKLGMMRKVSASFRYMVSQCPKIKSRFLDFLKKKDEGSITIIMKGITIYKINRIFGLWGAQLRKLNYDKQAFILWLKDSCNNPKFKLPWMMSDISEAIKYCMLDLESRKLLTEFNHISYPYFCNNGEKKG